MYCALSGNPTTNPVISPDGFIFDKTAISEFLKKAKICPVTEKPLVVSDLIEIKFPNPESVPPRQLVGESVPGLLRKFQSEYESISFEKLSLIKQIEEIRDEISKTLYQNDAACRLVARILKEKEEILKEIEQIQKSTGKPTTAPKPEFEALPGIDNETKHKITQKHQQLSTQRKQQVTSPNLAKVEDIKTYKQISSFPPHQAARPGILCIDLHPLNQELIVTGGVDKTAVVFNCSVGKKLATLTGHKKQVNSALFHPTEELIITASSDAMITLWGATSSNWTAHKTLHQITQHTGEIVSCSLHPTNEFLLSASRDSTWAFHVLTTGQTLVKVPEPEKSPLTCVMFHPDGLIFATGTDSNEIRIWDIKSQKNVANFPGHTDSITDVCFSENGFYLASAAKDNILKLWDLRGPKMIDSLKMDAAVKKLRYDGSGKYLGVATGAEIRIFTGKTLEHVHTLDEHTALVTDLKFANEAQFLASTSLDRTLKIWGK